VGVIFQCGRLVLLHLLAPRVRRYFPADVLAALEPPAPSSVDGMLSWLFAIVSVNEILLSIYLSNFYMRNFVDLYLTVTDRSGG